MSVAVESDIVLVFRFTWVRICMEERFSLKTVRRIINRSTPVFISYETCTTDTLYVTSSPCVALRSYMYT